MLTTYHRLWFASLHAKQNNDLSVCQAKLRSLCFLLEGAQAKHEGQVALRDYCQDLEAELVLELDAAPFPLPPNLPVSPVLTDADVLSLEEVLQMPPLMDLLDVSFLTDSQPPPKRARNESPAIAGSSAAVGAQHAASTVTRGPHGSVFGPKERQGLGLGGRMDLPGLGHVPVWNAEGFRGRQTIQAVGNVSLSGGADAPQAACGAASGLRSWGGREPPGSTFGGRHQLDSGFVGYEPQQFGHSGKARHPPQSVYAINGAFEDEDGFGADFKTAREKLQEDEIVRLNRGLQRPAQHSVAPSFRGEDSGARGKSLGVRRKFQAPFGKRDAGGNAGPGSSTRATNSAGAGEDAAGIPEFLLNHDGSVPDRLKNLDARLIEMICNEVLDKAAEVSFDDIAGLVFAKKCVEEAVVWPMLRPDLFTGLRGPPKGLLLFGPPGTGKTLIGKAIASQSGSTFFSISSSSLMSKWVGEGEKMVRALFGVASCRQPAVIFIDEIDSLLSTRSENEGDAVRRVKTEFLVQLDGAGTCSTDRILVIGATNRPQELDDAARRRLSKRLYIPLPDEDSRLQLLHILLSKEIHGLTEDDLKRIVNKADGMSGADMKLLCMEAALGPMREVGDIRNVQSSSVRGIQLSDFAKAFKQVRPSVSPKDLGQYIQWNKQFGSFDSQDTTLDGVDSLDDL
uniref:AAA+ ATPase domain-containing protein n=1 Tax=Eutreptiella gymnastica TaxID=73025 RepID=A0A7S1ITK8_9EUGL|mmetsp:Transcript_40673/g.72791  ORF Transcript_40673/g.72791 Transcript_40673/m.72791 type:complete len:680 (+) Transcript_40673:109-2148(+)